MLEVRNLHAGYGRLTALKGIDIDVVQGSIVFVVGPNGAGKSTLLKTVAGIHAPATGSIRFERQAVNGQPPEKLCQEGLVLVPEGRHVFGTLTVRENLQLALGTRRDKSGQDSDLAEVLETFPVLKNRLDGAAGYLSGGEQQQLAIARALLLRPRLLMIDEPSLGLAPMVIDLVYEKLRQFNQAGLTLLVVEQSTARVMDLATHVYVLRNGQIALQRDTIAPDDERDIEHAYFGYSPRPESQRGP